MVDELSAIYPADVIKSIYEEAADEPFFFLYVDLCARSKQDMFFKRFDGGALVPEA